MFVGHYSVAFALKSEQNKIPLWVLFVAVQLLDFIWAPLVLLGIEKMRIAPGITAANPLDLYYMPYTHSLIGALAWSALAFLVYKVISRTKVAAGLIVALAVFLSRQMSSFTLSPLNLRSTTSGMSTREPSSSTVPSLAIG